MAHLRWEEGSYHGVGCTDKEVHDPEDHCSDQVLPVHMSTALASAGPFHVDQRGALRDGGFTKVTALLS